jgi:hypothetical protein
MANSYRVSKSHTRKKLDRDECLIRLTDDWAYTTEVGKTYFYHTIPRPEKETMAWQWYITFEGRRWHEAGPMQFRGRTRKTCMLCKKRIPVPLRVMFTLKGK